MHFCLLVSINRDLANTPGEAAFTAYMMLHDANIAADDEEWDDEDPEDDQAVDPETSGNGTMAAEDSPEPAADDHCYECGEDGRGRFLAARCDWLVIGGRYTGRLSLWSQYSTFFDRVEAIFGKVPDSEEMRPEDSLFVTLLWRKMGGCGPSPIHPRTITKYHLLRACEDLTQGYPISFWEDDAKVVDAQLYESVLRQYEGRREVYEENLEYYDLHGDPISPAFIGKKWLVVLDCHY